MNYFVTAIGTDSGKTLASAILCQALAADYWKPVQAGMPTDTDEVKRLVINPEIKFHKEQYLLRTPASPHAAAKLDGISISLQSFTLPRTHNTLIIEGAGGCLVPINDEDFVIDLASHFNATVVLVANLYLGSINHTLLTIEALRNRKLNIKGIIFNGEPNAESERIILHHTKLKCLLHIKSESVIDYRIVDQYAQNLKTTWDE